MDSAWLETLPQDTGEIKRRNLQYILSASKTSSKGHERNSPGERVTDFNLPIYRVPPDIKQSLSGGYFIYVVRIYTE